VSSRAADVAVIGAGPYGLAAAAHLRAAGVETVVFGEPMSFWRGHMPEGMLLRSSPTASSISDANRRLTLERYYEANGRTAPNPVPLDDFLAYADWFRASAGLTVDAPRVTRIETARSGFRLHLDGDALHVTRVVVAAGIAPFARRPRAFRSLAEPLVVHSVDVRSVAPFKDRRVAVIGAGQSALETAALLHEAGADVEVVARAPSVHWIPTPNTAGLVTRIRRIAHAPTEVGPRGVSWVAALPDLFRRLPPNVQAQIGPACLAPMGAYWLPSRMQDVRFTLGRDVGAAERRNGTVLLRLSGGESREVDHVVLGTGFHVDVRRYDFLAPELVSALQLADGSPVLGTGLESSVPGLHFVGATAVHTFGPVMRFVVGTAYAAPALARHVVGRAPLPLIRAW
jgi:NADPH-dependent 2,4-dienoyl-CoA reductase/sulfur reductase-like enzyme